MLPRASWLPAGLPVLETPFPRGLCTPPQAMQPNDIFSQSSLFATSGAASGPVPQPGGKAAASTAGAAKGIAAAGGASTISNASSAAAAATAALTSGPHFAANRHQLQAHHEPEVRLLLLHSRFPCTAVSLAHQSPRHQHAPASVAA